MNSSDAKYMPNILNRDIISREIYWHDRENDYQAKDYINRLINRWKNLLHQNGVVKGNLVTISMFTVDMYHISAILACAEMGLKIFILDSPATKESLPYTKLALHGPSDFYLHHDDSHMSAYDGLHGEMLKRYGGKSINSKDLENISTEDLFVEVYPDDPLLMSSTSGTTKPSRPVTFSHKEVMTISRRNVNVFKFDENSKVIHSRNLHHASAMLTSLIPSLMVVNHHMSFPLGHIVENSNDMKLYRRLRDYEYTHIMIPNKNVLMNFLETYELPFRTKLNINMCGFTIDQSFVELAEKYNIEFHSHYGSIDTAIPFLINFVDKNSIVEDNCLGVMPDQFYGMVMDGNRVEIHSDLWNEPRYIEDELEFRDGQFYIRPRKLPEVPDDVDLEPFFQDTKINFEQLRGYLNERNKS